MAKKRSSKYERVRAGGRRNQTDAPGKIQVKVIRIDDDGRSTKGNICRTMTIAKARVSEVFADIERALFSA